MRYPDLRSFDMICLKKIREGGGEYNTLKSFLDELEVVLKDNVSESNRWERMENDEIVLGKVWRQYIGNYYYKHTVHKFSYLYVGTSGLAIDWHGHEETANYGKQIRKVEEWYVFPDGKVLFCGKGEKHRLFNKFDKPIYVLSVKVCSNGTR